MKMLFDFFPIVAFYIAYKLFSIYVATGVLIAATGLQVGYLWFKHKKVPPMYIITFLLILIFGGLTIALHDIMFLKWKVSIINWLFGLAFIGYYLFSKKTLVGYLMGQALTLPRPVWVTLNWMWAIFFLVQGTINIIVVYSFSTAAWVDFKVFGLTGLMLVFMVIQIVYLHKHIKDMPQK
jgi:intracellular septation protein